MTTRSRLCNCCHIRQDPWCTQHDPQIITHTCTNHTHTPQTHTTHTHTHTHTHFIVFARSEDLSKPTIPDLSWIWQMIKYRPTASGNSTYCTIAGCKFPPCDFWPVNIGQKFLSLIHSLILSEKYFLSANFLLGNMKTQGLLWWL